jgi:hypothetical protein
MSLVQLIIKDITFYIQGWGFKFQISHLFTLRVKFLATSLPKKIQKNS